jgi:hypothetical protein
MVNKSLTVRDLFGTDSKAFSPLDIDLSEVKALSDAMPKDGNIDINNAEVLATKYLRGADICGELLAIATAFVAKTKSKKEIAYNRAFVKFKDDKKIKTDKMRAAMAEIDNDYIEATNRYNEALAFVKWIDSKYNSFNKMHYLCKKILDRAYPHEKSAYWSGSVTENDAKGW